MAAWLPLDDAREQAARVWLAFTAAAAVTPRLATMAADVDGRLRDWFAAELESLRSAGLLAPGVATHPAAAQLLALIDGVTAQALSSPIAERQALVDDTIDRFVDRLAGAHQSARGR